MSCIIYPRLKKENTNGKRSCSYSKGYGHELLEEIEGMLVAKGIKSLQTLRRKGREESSREI